MVYWGGAPTGWPCAGGGAFVLGGAGSHGLAVCCMGTCAGWCWSPRAGRVYWGLGGGGLLLASCAGPSRVKIRTVISYPYIYS